jgi:peptide chain release factor 2
MEKLHESFFELKNHWQQVANGLDLDNKKIKTRELEAQSLKANFWTDSQAAGKIMSELSSLQNEVKDAEEITSSIDSAIEMVGLLKNDHSLAQDLEEEFSNLQNKVAHFETLVFLSGKFDIAGAIISIHAGQGGTEAMDWSEMILRMYLRYFESQNWKVEILDETKGEEAGIKSVTLQVEGSYAYGYLKNESGTHRLVRQSPFNADHLRQTSFALVEVLPVIDDAPELKIKSEDIKMDAYRASGAGGQNVNKVNSAVRLTHLPTGITVAVQTERSQLQNREYAMKILRAKLWELEEAKRRGEMQALKGDYRPASWGNQIRSYVLHPYKMVKDLRTSFETSDAESVLDGNLSGFIEAELRL